MHRSSSYCGRPFPGAKGRPRKRNSASNDARSRSIPLILKLGLEGLLALRHRGLIARRIHPHVFRGARLDSIEFRQHAEIRPMRTQENVAGKCLQYHEGVAVVRLDTRVRGRLSRAIHQSKAWIHIPAADDDGVEKPPAVLHLQCPGGTSSSVARRLVRSENG